MCILAEGILAKYNDVISGWRAHTVIPGVYMQSLLKNLTLGEFMRERNTKAEVWGQSLILAFALICTAGAHVTHSSETTRSLQKDKEQS